MMGPFTLIVLGVGAIAFFFAVRAVLGYQEVSRDAEADYSYKITQGMIPENLSKAGYIKAYRRYYAPRAATFIAGALGAILILTYPAMGLIYFLLDQAWIATGRGDTMHPGYLVWQFLIFFGILGVWASIIYLSARQFHRGAPISFKNELEKQLS